MNNYIVRNILIILGIPMIAYIILQAFNWYGNMTENHDLAPLSTERIQFPLHHPWGVGGVKRFQALGPAEQASLLELLGQSITDMDPWLDQLNDEGFSLLCLGENHDGHLRNLIAAQILPRLPTDFLMLEATRTHAANIGHHMWARDFNALLGKDITAIARAVKATNPDSRILGIEETKRQFDIRRGGDGNSRDLTIEKNLKAVYRPGKRHLVLYGAFHCSHQTKFYSRLKVDPPTGAEKRMLNIRVTHEHTEAPIETFVYFLDEIGFTSRSTANRAGDIVITDTAAIAKRLREWFPFFAANELEHYGALVIMRPLLYASQQESAFQP